MIQSYKGRTVSVGDTVYAYRNRNLHKSQWSLRATSGEHKGRVVGHADSVVLFGCAMHGSEAGRQRVLREKKKSVHAGVVGLVTSHPDDSTIGALFGGPRKLSYNPYRGSSFTVGDTPVEVASYVHLADDGKAYAIGAVN